MVRPAATREELIARLSEAAEVEHNLMCVYLYAAFSLKDSDDGSLTANQASAVKRWRSEIMTVAREEMLHLLLVSNLLTAIGGAAHFGRMNFPIPPGSLPADMQVRLSPFNRETLQHFIWLERPDGVEEPMGNGFRPLQQYQRGAANDARRLMPHAIDYPTVGGLYSQIEADLDALAHQLGEEHLFIGDPAGQIDMGLAGLPGAVRVNCLKTAHAAVHSIVEQGEGARSDDATSHYARFRSIRSEYDELVSRDGGFVPAWPAANNPVMRRPPTPEGKVWIEADRAATVVDLANALYAHMLRLLIQAFGRIGPASERALLLDAAIGLMQAMTPVAEFAARLPAREGESMCTAGVSFATLRSLAPLPQGPAEWRMLTERMGELAGAARTIASWDPRLASASGVLNRLSGEFQTQTKAWLDQPVYPESAIALVSPRGQPPIPVIENGVELIEGEKLTLVFEAKRCIHARFCVTGLPEVFKANVEGPWIDPDAATVEALVEVAHACPSGAIRYLRKDGAPDESAPPVNMMRLRENGPYAVHADITLAGKGAMTRVTLCRCGASRNKPYCDGSHSEIGFAATGEPVTQASDPLAQRGGSLSVTPLPNGPLQVRGPLEMCAGTGRTIDRVTGVRLCRCGGSNTKPYCDNTHLTNGFTAD